MAGRKMNRHPTTAGFAGASVEPTFNRGLNCFRKVVDICLRYLRFFVEKQFREVMAVRIVTHGFLESWAGEGEDRAGRGI